MRFLDVWTVGALVGSVLSEEQQPLTREGVRGGSLYNSRPDIHPSKLNVTIYEPDKVYEGYLYSSPWAAPWTNDFVTEVVEKVGAHVFRGDGELVWTGYGVFPNDVGNLMPQIYNGEQVFTFYNGLFVGGGIGLGTYKVVNSDFEVVKRVGLKTPFLHDIHEFVFTGEDTAAFTSYKPVPYDFKGLEEYTSLQTGWVYRSDFVEVNVTTDEVLFQWNSLDHVPIEESLVLSDLAIKGNTSINPFDYLHVNSITKDDRGNFLISARHTWSIYYIDGTTGDVIWRLGGNSTDWTIHDNATFAYQHHARWVDPEEAGLPNEPHIRYISLFDNEGYGDHLHQIPGYRNYSRGTIIKLDHESLSVSLVQEYLLPHPEKTSDSQGNLQVLPNGNILIGWGANPVITEHLFTGKPIFHAVINDKEYASYRAFKGPFEGNPKEPPALVSIYDSNKNVTTIHISWNGSTKTKAWNIYTPSHLLSTIPHNTFETTYHVQGHYKSLKVEALDRNGVPLADSHFESSYQI
jgi:hypothetical protein